MTYYKINAEKNGVEVYFSTKPAEAIRDELKESGFRWGRGFWWAKQTPERLALAQRLTNGTEEKTEEKPAAKQAKTGTPQNRIKVYYNGLKLDGGSLTKCRFTLYGDDVYIIADGYGAALPRDLFQVSNETDYYTDYFDKDSATVTPDHPLYTYIRYAAMKSEAKMARRHLEWLTKRGYIGKESYKNEVARSKAKIEAFEAMEDPGQPTAEDLEKINAEREAEENRIREEEHKKQLEEREKVLAERHEGFEYINNVAALYPIKDGEPTVTIPFSENPAFYSFMVADTTKTTLHPDGTTTEEVLYKMPRCVLSVHAAEVVLKHFDKKVYAQGRGYDKTDFIIEWTDESGEPFTYSGRYDLGDNDGGLIAHIKALGEWERTHEPFGKVKAQPDETNDRIMVADFLAGFIPNENGEGSAA